MRKNKLVALFFIVLLFALTLSACDNSASDLSKTIPIESAKEAAVSAAGLTMADVTFTKAEIDSDDTPSHYEIEYTDGDNIYEYKIDAVSAKVISESREQVSSPQPITDKPDPDSPQPAEGVDINAARQIAFDRAGVTEADAQITKSEQDIEGGVMVFEFEFIADGQEFEVTVNAETGEVIEFSQEKAGV